MKPKKATNTWPKKYARHKFYARGRDFEDIEAAIVYAYNKGLRDGYSWISVEEKLPKERVDVLVLCEKIFLEPKVKANFNLPEKMQRIGYIRIWSEGPFWVVPKYEQEGNFEFVVTHWVSPSELIQTPVLEKDLK